MSLWRRQKAGAPLTAFRSPSRKVKKRPSNYAILLIHHPRLPCTIMERSRRRVEIDRKADRGIREAFASGSVVDDEREDLHVEVEAADSAAKQ